MTTQVRCAWACAVLWGAACVSLTALPACGRHFSRAVQRQHAALYGCAPTEVHVEMVAAVTYVARGCGQRAVYLCRRGGVCDQRADAVEPGPDPRDVDARRRQREQARRARAGAAHTAIRSNPRAPELRGTQAEANVICDQQGGTLVATLGPDGAEALRCTLDGWQLFGAHVDPTSRRIDQVDVMLEGASAPTVRGRYESRWGPGAESVGSNGLRRWTWCRRDGVWIVRMHRRGVWLTVRTPDLRVPPSEPGCPTSAL